MSLRPLQAKLFFFAETKLESDAEVVVAEPQLSCSDSQIDPLKSRITAAFGLFPGKNLHRFASLALKSRIDARKRVLTGKSLHRFPSLGLKSRIDAGCSPFLSTRSTTRSSTRLALDLLHGAGSSWLRQWRQKRVLMRPEAAFP